MFRYTLDKSSRKYICPKCNKKTFVRYIDNLTNEFIGLQYGRCDRESNCKHHNSIPQSRAITPSTQLLKRPIKPKSTIDKTMLAIHGRNFKHNNFIQFLKIHFSIDEIKQVILKYCIGTSDFWQGSSIFWQINNKEEVVTGKVMLFDKESGKRIKQPYNHINWMHKVLKLQEFQLEQCLFGLHLINEYGGKTIAIVESEKTAIIMSIFLPNYLWLATGSKVNFKQELLEPLKQYEILVFPDKSEYQDWNKKTLKLRKTGFKIKCSSLIEEKEVQKGYDLADYYIDCELNNKIEKRNIKYTETEIAISSLVKKNIELVNLIRTFNLVDKYNNDIINYDL